MAIIYILKSLKDSKTYVGSTTDMERRLGEHNAGKVTSTKPRRPLELIYTEKVDTIEQARKREHYLKSAAGRRWLKKMVFNNGE